MKLIPVSFVSFDKEHSLKNGEVGVLHFSPGDEIDTVLNISFNEENMKQLLEAINGQVEIVGGEIVWKDSYSH
jgi:hypothetical protein